MVSTYGEQKSKHFRHLISMMMMMMMMLLMELKDTHKQSAPGDGRRTDKTLRLAWTARGDLWPSIHRHFFLNLQPVKRSPSNRPSHPSD